MAAAGALAVAGAMTVATPADAGAAARASTADRAAHAAPVAAGTRVLVRLTFPRCNACEVRMQQYSHGDFWQSRSKHVRKNEIRFFVKRAHTVGSIFTVHAPGMRGLPYVPLIALHYRGFAVGEDVSNAEARMAKFGAPCWGGGRLDITVRSHRFATTTSPGTPTTGIRAWARVTLPRMGPYLATDHGAVGTQDVVPCNNPH
jgi:hypothetical protein